MVDGTPQEKAIKLIESYTRAAKTSKLRPPPCLSFGLDSDNVQPTVALRTLVKRERKRLAILVKQCGNSGPEIIGAGMAAFETSDDRPDLTLETHALETGRAVLEMLSHLVAFGGR